MMALHASYDFANFPVLETERLTLREINPEDVSAILKHFGNPEVIKFIEMQPIRTMEQAREWLQWMGDHFSDDSGLRWGVMCKENQVCIGSARLQRWNRECRYAEIGYNLAPQYWEKGYATEIARAVVEFGWQTMHLNRIEAKVTQGNQSAMRVLEKLGFKQEGILRQRWLKGGKYYDVHFYSLLLSEYQASTP